MKFLNILKLARAPDWAFSKLPFLAAAYILNRDEPSGLSTLALVVLMIAGQAAFGFSINDIADEHSDAKGGKANRAAGLSGGVLILAPTAAATVALAASYYAGRSAPPVLLTAANLALAVAYSSTPFRLKERGAFGVATAAASQWALPCLAVLSIEPGALMRGETWIFAGLGLAIGVRWIGVHQAIDLAADIRSGTTTFATSGGRVGQLAFLAFAAEIALLGVGAFIWVDPYAAAIALGACLFHAYLVRREKPPLQQALLSYAHAPLASFYFFALPVCAAALNMASASSAVVATTAFVVLGWSYAVQMAGELADAVKSERRS